MSNAESVPVVCTIFKGAINNVTAPSAGSATYYVQLIDAASVPADGAVTLLMAPLKIVHTTGTDSAFDIDLLHAGINGATGLVWCISSTEFTKTITGAVASTTALYK